MVIRARQDRRRRYPQPCFFEDFAGRAVFEGLAEFEMPAGELQFSGAVGVFPEAEEEGGVGCGCGWV